MWKVNKRFVTQKYNISMVSSGYKWLSVLGILVLFAFTPAASKKLVAPAVIHPLYISVSEMEYNAIERALEISCKVFTDDFEKALNKASNSPVDLYKPRDSAVIQKLVAQYLQKHFQVKLDGKPVTLEFVGHELEEQSTWSYFQVSKLNAMPRKIEIVNNIFFELYDKQINIMHVSVGGTRKSTKLDYPVAVATFEF
ncbi:MAG: hypothetical protein H7Y31_17795 [Chitinophagaceae bacterium]|nr:hypothetical protein [Chitinophagaceae bacterium]